MPSLNETSRGYVDENSLQWDLLWVCVAGTHGAVELAVNEPAYQDRDQLLVTISAG